MFERETRREKILEAIDLNREMQLKQKNKNGLLNLLTVKKQKYSLADKKETEEVKVNVDPLVEAGEEFYRILNEVMKMTFPVKYVLHFISQVKSSRKTRPMDSINEYDWLMNKPCYKIYLIDTVLIHSDVCMVTWLVRISNIQVIAFNLQN